MENLLGQLTRLLELAAEIGERGSAVDLPGMQAVYGVTVRVGPKGSPVIGRFGNVRQDAGHDPVVDRTREPMTDLFDEGDRYVIVAELPGVGHDAVHWRVRDGSIVVIDAESRDRAYHKEVPLPSPAEGGTGVSCCENGVMELRLWKQQRR